MPRVTINDGNAKKLLKQPLTSPHRVPVMRPSIKASGNGSPYTTAATPATAELSPTTEPTDRSIQPTINTRVMPTATTVSAGSWLSIEAKVVREKKLSDAMPKKTINSAQRTGGKVFFQTLLNRLDEHHQGMHSVQAAGGIFTECRCQDGVIVPIVPVKHFDRFAIGQNQDAMAEFHQFLDFTGDDDQCPAPGGQLREKFMEEVFCGYINPARGFVQKKNIGAFVQPAAHQHFLLVAAAQQLDVLVCVHAFYR